MERNKRWSSLTGRSRKASWRVWQWSETCTKWESLGWGHPDEGHGRYKAPRGGNKGRQGPYHEGFVGHWRMLDFILSVMTDFWTREWHGRQALFFGEQEWGQGHRLGGCCCSGGERRQQLRLEKQQWKWGFFEGRVNRLANGLDVECKKESRITARFGAQQLECVIC